MGSIRPYRICCALGAAAGLAVAQPETDGRRPRAADRVVRVFDFEERLTNATDVPQGWVRAQHDPLVPRHRPDFPIWNQARLDYETAARGEGSVRLDVRGGSTSLRLLPGVLPVFPNGEYAVRVAVRASGLKHARPRVVARLLDAQARPIEGSEREVRIDNIDDRWRTVEVRIPGTFASAAHLQIDLEVVQQRVFARPVLGAHQVWEEDVSGAAWFDDLTIVQVPQVGIGAEAPMNVVARPAAPRVVAEVRDLAGEQLTATMTIYDAARRLVDSHVSEVAGGRAKLEWTPRLDRLGWYRAFIDVRSPTGLVSSQSCDIVWVDVAPPAETRYRAGPAFDGASTNATGRSEEPGTFSIELPSLPDLEPDALTALVQGTGSSSVSIPLWSGDVSIETLPARVNRIRSFSSSLRSGWIDVVLSLPVVPDEIASTQLLKPGDVLGAMSAPPSVWEPYLIDGMERLGTTLSRWQFGSGLPRGVGVSARSLGALGSMRDELSRKVPGIEIEIGWRADLPASLAAGADAARVLVPSWTSAGDVELLAAEWAGSDVRPVFSIEPLGTDRHLERDVAAEVARRATLLWATGEAPGGADLVLPTPWTVDPGDRGSVRPTPALGAWRALSDRLRGRAFVADWDFGPRTTCMLFAPGPGEATGRGGLLVAWSLGDPDAEIVATLGAGPVTVYDVFGNGEAHEPAPSEDGARLEHRIALGPEPVFVEGIDTDLVRFLASIALDPPLIESVAGEREHALVLRNPWPTPITGSLVITEPGGYDPGSNAKDRTWEITPRSAGIDLAPGETQRVPVSLLFSRATQAGAVPFAIDLRLSGERDYGWVRARPRAEVDWEAVEMHLTYRPVRGEGGTDLIIEATVTNTGETARALEAVAFAPGQPRARSAIGTLPAGESIVRRFAFPGAFDALAGERVYVALSEPDGTGRLNKSIEISSR